MSLQHVKTYKLERQFYTLSQTSMIVIKIEYSQLLGAIASSHPQFPAKIEYSQLLGTIASSHPQFPAKIDILPPKNSLKLSIDTIMGNSYSQQIRVTSPYVYDPADMDKTRNRIAENVYMARLRERQKTHVSDEKQQKALITFKNQLERRVPTIKKIHKMILKHSDKNKTSLNIQLHPYCGANNDSYGLSGALNEWKVSYANELQEKIGIPGIKVSIYNADYPAIFSCHQWSMVLHLDWYGLCAQI
jgi:hypothetical protein